MLNVIDVKGDNVVGIHIDGKVSDKEFEHVADLLEEKLENHKKIRLYAEMESYGGMSPETFLKDLKFSVEHWRQFEKEAVVTDQEWMQKMTATADKLFPGIAVKAFPFEEKKWAKKWISE